MTVTAAPRAPYSPVAHLADVLRSELWKLRTVRSTYWTLLAAVVSNVALAALLGILLPSYISAREQATIDSTRVSLGGLHLSQVAFGVLGVLVITSEYGTGMIRATLAAVPPDARGQDHRVRGDRPHRRDRLVPRRLPRLPGVPARR